MSAGWLYDRIKYWLQPPYTSNPIPACFDVVGLGGIRCAMHRMRCTRRRQQTRNEKWKKTCAVQKKSSVIYCFLIALSLTWRVWWLWRSYEIHNRTNYVPLLLLLTNFSDKSEMRTLGSLFRSFCRQFVSIWETWKLLPANAIAATDPNTLNTACILHGLRECNKNFVLNSKLTRSSHISCRRSTHVPFNIFIFNLFAFDKSVVNVSRRKLKANPIFVIEFMQIFPFSRRQQAQAPNIRRRIVYSWRGIAWKIINYFATGIKLFQALRMHKMVRGFRLSNSIKLRSKFPLPPSTFMLHALRFGIYNTHFQPKFLVII